MRIDSKIRDQYSPEIYQEATKIFFDSHENQIMTILSFDEDDRKRFLHKMIGGAAMLGYTELVMAIRKAEAKSMEEELMMKVVSVYDSYKLLLVK